MSSVRLNLLALSPRKDHTPAWWQKYQENLLQLLNKLSIKTKLIVMLLIGATLIKSARKVGAGEFDAVVKLGSQDEFGDLAKSFNQTIDSLRNESNLIEQKNLENEALVLSIFSPAIAKRLKQGDREIADQISNVSVLFSDLDQFTLMNW